MTPWMRNCLLACLILLSGAVMAAIVLPDSSEPEMESTGRPESGRIHSIRPAEPSAQAVAVDQLILSAQGGDVDAMLKLGYHYYSNPSLPQAMTQARRWWQQAAQAGDVRAMLGLGHLLSGGSSGLRDVPAAQQWLTLASDMGVPRAVYLRSLLARDSIGPRTQQEARALLEQAARDGDVMALNDLGVERELTGSVREAQRLYQTAAEAGLDVARQNLERIRSAERDDDGQALARLRTLAAEGDADALLALAIRYHKGDGVQHDYARAILNYQRAADAGSLKAREFLALIFSHSNEQTGSIDQAWMQEVATRISAASIWAQTRRAPALNRPTRVSDPLSDLFTPLAHSPVAQ